MGCRAIHNVVKSLHKVARVAARLSLPEHFVSEHLNRFVPQLSSLQITSPLLDFQDPFALEAIDHVVDRSARKPEALCKVLL